MFSFSVRDLLWLTLTVAVAMGWLVHNQIIQTRAEQHLQAKAAEEDWLRGQFDALKSALEYNGWCVEIDAPPPRDYEPFGAMHWPMSGETHHRATIYRRSHKPDGS
jgi:hypothetical protein